MPWRQRLFAVGVGLMLIVLLPVYLAYLLLVEFPRESLRGWIWSVGRRSDALPGSDSEPARRAAVEALLQQATTLDAVTVARVGAGLNVVPSGDIDLEVHDAPSDLREAVRTVRAGALDAMTRRALAIAPEIVVSAPHDSRSLYVTGAPWRGAVAALESASAAAFLGTALDEAVRDRWVAPWQRLLKAHAVTSDA